MPRTAAALITREKVLEALHLGQLPSSSFPRGRQWAGGTQGAQPVMWAVPPAVTAPRTCTRTSRDLSPNEELPIKNQSRGMLSPNHFYCFPYPSARFIQARRLRCMGTPGLTTRKTKRAVLLRGYPHAAGATGETPAREVEMRGLPGTEPRVSSCTTRTAAWRAGQGYGWSQQSPAPARHGLRISE